MSLITSHIAIASYNIRTVYDKTVEGKTFVVFAQLQKFSCRILTRDSLLQEASIAKVFPLKCFVIYGTLYGSYNDYVFYHGIYIHVL